MGSDRHGPTQADMTWKKGGGRHRPIFPYRTYFVVVWWDSLSLGWCDGITEPVRMSRRQLIRIHVTQLQLFISLLYTRHWMQTMLLTISQANCAFDWFFSNCHVIPSNGMTLVLSYSQRLYYSLTNMIINSGNNKSLTLLKCQRTSSRPRVYSSSVSWVKTEISAQQRNTDRLLSFPTFRSRVQYWSINFNH